MRKTSSIKLQVEDIFKDDELSEIPRGTGGEVGSTIGLGTSYSCCAGKTSQTGLLNRSDRF